MPRAIEPPAFPWADYAGATFALGLAVDGDAINSGHSGAVLDQDSGRMVVRGGMGEQTEVAYAKQEAILAAVGLGWSDVTRVVENVTLDGLAHYGEAEEVRRRTFGEHQPTVVTVVVDRLVRRKAWVEIEVHATPGGGEALVVGATAGESWVRRDTVRAGHDGAVYLPTLLPLDASGDVIAEGDVVGQYFACLERAGELLTRAGLDLSHVVSTVDYSTPATRERYPKTGRARRDLLGPVYPGAAGILMSELHTPGVLLALEVVASRHDPIAVNPGWDRYDSLTYTPGIRAGNTLYMSGFAALDMDTQAAVHPGDLKAQAEVTYDAMLQTMAAVGSGPEHLLTTVEYVVPGALPDYRAVADVRRARLAPPYPASTGIVCGGLLRDEFLIEVVPTALIPGPVLA
jgi:enamine deaminase RidA (YjgF/YER057c/UK114 family)